MNTGVAMAYRSSSAVSSGLPLSLRVLFIAVAITVIVVGALVRARNVQRYTRVSPWKKLLLWDTSPWSLTGRMVRRSADREQAEAERMAVFAATQTAVAQQHGYADPAARFGMVSLPEQAPAAPPTTETPAGGFPPPTDAPFPPPRPMPSAPTADDVLPS